MLNYTQKPHKLKKALCTFIFLFFNAQNYSCCSKISKRFTRESQMGTRESQNGHSGLLKWLVSLVISKLALLPILRLPLAHLRLPHEPFLKFSSQQEKFFSSKKEKNKRTNYYFQRQPFLSLISQCAHVSLPGKSQGIWSIEKKHVISWPQLPSETDFR